ncbi:hypothetical protein ACSBR1_034504 [Camellia fascicularis]
MALGEPLSISHVQCYPFTLPCRWHGPRAVTLVLSDSEPCAGTLGLRPPFPRQVFVTRCGLRPRLPLTLRTTTKAFAKDVFINQERKLGARRRSDTVLVSAINDADQGSADVTFRTPLAPYEKSKFLGSGGSMVARLKLKGIDGRAPRGNLPGPDIVRIDRLRALS